MKKLRSVLIFLSISLNLLAQKTTELRPKPVHSLGLGVGLSHTALKNSSISPLIFSGLGAPLHLTYRRESAKTKHYLQVQYQAQNLKSPFGFSIEEMGGHLIYGYLKKIKSHEKTTFYVGGNLQIQGVQRTMPQGQNNYSLMVLSTLNISGSMNYTLNKHLFEAQISVSTFGYNLWTGNSFNRNMDDGFFKTLPQNAQFQLPPNYLNASLRVSYFLPTASPHWRCRVDYWGNYYGFKERRFSDVLHNQLTTSVVYQF